MSKALRIIEQHVHNVELPMLANILYVHPNPDASMRTCNNCMMWVKTEDKCVIHDPDLVEVTADMICGYYVYGRPMKMWMDHPGIDYVDPRYSGLEVVPSGTACKNCEFFDRADLTAEHIGLCRAARTEDGFANPEVHSLGCCARWEKCEATV